MPALGVVGMLQSCPRMVLLPYMLCMWHLQGCILWEIQNLQALGSWHGVLAVMFQHPGVLLAALDCSTCSCAMLISSSWRRRVSMWGVLKVPAGGICRICRR